MSDDEVNQLEHGIYRIYWLSGGSSLASVGSLHSGRRWFAPANWTSFIETGIASTSWERIERVELIEINVCSVK